jgi:hypothetical protein
MQQEQVRRLAELLSQNLLRQMQALDDHPQEADGVLPQIEQWLTLLAGDHKALPVLVAHDAERNGPMLPVPAAGAVPQLHHDALPTCPVCTTIQTTWLARCRAPFASEESFPPVGACCANHHWLLAMGLFLPEPCDRQVIARYSAWLREQGKRQAHALAHAQEVQSDQPARCSACANIAETSAAAIRAFLRDMQETAGDARFPQGMLCLWHWKQAHDACRQWPDAPALRRRLFDRQQQALGVLGRALDAYLARFNASKRQRGEVPDVAGSDGACPRVLAFFAGEAADLR